MKMENDLRLLMGIIIIIIIIIMQRLTHHEVIRMTNRRRNGTGNENHDVATRIAGKYPTVAQ